MQAVLKTNEGRIDYTTSSDVACGQVVPLTAFCAVATSPIPANTNGSLATTGNFEVAKTAGTSTAIARGAKVYWDNTNKVATATASGNTPLGLVTAAAVDADTTVRVWLHPV